MTTVARRVVVLVTIMVLVFATGFAAGLWFAPQQTAEVDDHGHSHAANDDHAAGAVDEGDPPEHVALTEQAFHNLGLKLDKITPREYWKSQAVPGDVVEIPGQSRLKVSAPVTGVIESILVRDGQSVSSADALCTLRITDEYLAAAQSKWLAGIARREIVEKEIARLAPLTATGAVAGRRTRDLEYELSQLRASQLVARQDMLARGLPDSTIDRIAAGRSLATTLEITVPTASANGDQQPGEVRPVVFTPSRPRDYSIEEIMVYAGQTVNRGDVLCTLDHHSELYIRGQAFEADVPLLDQLSERSWRVSAEFGHDHDDPDETTIVTRQLPLLRIDNMVSPESQTFTFYLPLRNEVTQTLTDEAGREFTHWRFKPGQRVHLRIPVERWRDQLVLPLAAVVIEGPNAMVFVEHEEPAHQHEQFDHDHDHDEDDHDDHDHEADAHAHGAECDHDHDHAADDHAAGDHQHAHDEDDGHQHAGDEEVFVELEPVPVQILHRDERFVVIANDGQIPTDRRIALNSAYELQQALRMESSGGGQPHPHEH